MSQIAENLKRVEEKIAAAALRSGRTPSDINLVAVTKTHPPELINEAIECGVTDIGENKVQEVIDKFDLVHPKAWHLIGHLQTNKVKHVVGNVSLIHSVDSIKLLDEIERQAVRMGVTQDVLIQINISGEMTKFGIHKDELSAMLEHVSRLTSVKVCGLMTIAPKANTEKESVTNKLHFHNINQIYIDIQSKTYDNVNIKYLSMGMSGDYETAIEAGSNIVRVGSAIFGNRNYF